jgi:hypothetical protein
MKTLRIAGSGASTDISTDFTTGCLTTSGGIGCGGSIYANIKVGAPIVGTELVELQKNGGDKGRIEATSTSLKMGLENQASSVVFTTDSNTTHSPITFNIATGKSVGFYSVNSSKYNCIVDESTVYPGTTANMNLGGSGARWNIVWAEEFNLPSDYRLKNSVSYDYDALSKISALKPCVYNRIGKDKQEHGFIAHEIQQTFPNIVSGQKDEVDEDGKPVYQGIQHTELISVLVKATQQLMAANAALEARVAALENSV